MKDRTKYGTIAFVFLIITAVQMAFWWVFAQGILDSGTPRWAVNIAVMPLMVTGFTGVLFIIMMPVKKKNGGVINE